MSGSLQGKTLFITGASRGIGLAIALRAARDGANIAIAAKTDTPHPKLEGTIHTAAAAIEAAGGRALPLLVDVRDEASGAQAIEAPAKTFGGLDTTVDGEVINAWGEAVPGLYAAGRCSAGLPVAPYYASGLSIGDGCFFGRRAATHAARRKV